VTFVGRSGVQSIAGIRVGFLSGSADQSKDMSSRDAVSVEDVALLAQQADSAPPAPLDVLLSAVWPRGVHLGIPAGVLPVREDEDAEAGSRGVSREAVRVLWLREVGSRAVAAVCAAQCPRYHFAGGAGVFFQRAPFGATRFGVETRFVGVASPAHAAREHSRLHAVQLEPWTPPSAAAFHSPPHAPSPFAPVAVAVGEDKVSAARRTVRAAAVAQLEREARALEAGMAEGSLGQEVKRARIMMSASERLAVETAEAGRASSSQFFWDLSRRGGGRGGGERVAPLGTGEAVDVADPSRRLPPGAVRECWFCPSSPSFQRHLVVSVSEEVVMTRPRGAVDEWHVLLVPIAHVPALSKCPPAVLQELRRYQEGYARMARAAGRTVVASERAVRVAGPAHAHLSLWAVPLDRAGLVERAVEDCGRRHGVGFRRMSESEELAAAMAEDDAQYVYFEVEHGVGGAVRLLHKVPGGMRGRHPLQLAREAVCAVLARPERAHWKDCATSEQEEEREAREMRGRFQAFDPFASTE